MEIVYKIKIRTLLVLILVGLFFIGCSDTRTSKKPTGQSKTDTVMTDSVSPPHTPVEKQQNFIKDSIQYSKNFIEELDNATGEPFSLVDSFFISGQDTFVFPVIWKMNSSKIFTGIKDKLAIALTIKQINYSSIQYKLEMVEFGKTNYKSNGIAHISSMFQKGVETDENPRTGNSYFVNEFSNSIDSCYTYIRIGIDEEDHRSPLVKLISNCNGKIRDINLDDFPTLIEK